MSKTLDAANTSLPAAQIERVEFLSSIAERDWIARQIRSLIDAGTAPKEIAVLAPKHKHLEPLVPYLNHYGIPVRYEKRENILEAPVVRELLTMCRLVLALEANNQPLADHLWPQVLSYNFWQLPTAAIWQIAWQVSDNRKEGGTWSKQLLENPVFQPVALLLLTTASHVHTETAETLLDMMIGNTAVETHAAAGTAQAGEAGQVAAGTASWTSPLREYYTGTGRQADNPELFYETVSHLTVLRSKLLDHQRSGDKALTLHDFIRFVGMYEAAEQQMINTSPYSQQADSVQLMTVFKAKGLEYAHVFLPSVTDDVWGASSSGGSNKITLPANLAPIRHAGASEDERLRILFVALTRAKYGLHLTSATQNYNGKPTKRLKYLDEREQPDNSFLAMALPENARQVRSEDASPPELRLLEIDWHARHLDAISQADLRGLLSDRLERYQLSPTHVTDFINLEYAGPQKFFFKSLLRFPETPLPDAQFGTAIHETLEWFQYRTSEHGSAPTTADTIAYFRTIMGGKRLSERRIQLEIERGEKALAAYLKQRAFIYTPTDQAEKNFHNEGVFVGEAHMSGQVDRLEIDKQNKVITVVDYKTGNTYSSWRSDAKLYRYRLQLCLYKLLIEGSNTYKDYTVKQGRLEFIEPDDQGKVHALELTFADEEMARARGLVEALWRHVHDLNFPDTTEYPATVPGMKQFEQDLLDGKI
jgi:ATP-dependent exoDNAse (exonuclease V) beta subunit